MSRKSGDTIEIIIRDQSFNKIYKNTAHIGDDKQIMQLLFDLQSKGIDLFRKPKRKEVIKEDMDWFT